MTPIKAKDLIPDVSKDLNISKEECQQVIDLYYDDLRKNLSDLTFPYIFVAGLGRFYVKENWTKKSLERFAKIKDWYQQKKDSLRNRLILKSVEDQIERTKKCLEMIDYMKSKRTIVNEYKEWYVANKHRKNTEDYKREAENYKIRLESYQEILKNTDYIAEE